MALESSQNTLNILESLQDQDLLETFLPLDLDSLFVSTMVIIVTRFIDSGLLESQSPWLDKAYNFLEAMISNGNRIAEFRMSELQRLDEMLTEYTAGPTQLSSTFSAPQSNIDIHQPNFEPLLPNDSHATNHVPHCQDTPSIHTGISDESSGYGDDLTAEQILAAAESMDLEGTDWLSFATMENIQLMDTQEM